MYFVFIGNSAIKVERGREEEEEVKNVVVMYSRNGLNLLYP